MNVVNNTVQTPLGKGIVQGRFSVRAGDDAVSAVMVRMPIDDQTRAHLTKSNCLTPHASISGLWVFQESEIK
jgi:hypothetical protein